jgi:DNA polymerase-3 subunit delta'
MAYTVEKAFQLIESAHNRGRLAHAFLITGGAGSGKSELAARVVSLVNPEESTENGGMDLFGEPVEVEQKSLEELEGELVRIITPQSKSRRIRVDDIRRLEKSFYVAAPAGKWKVGVIMHADRMNEPAENAFLKTLEEPPENSLLLLISDAPDLLLPTILSRCVRISLLTSGGSRVLNASQNALLRDLATVAKSGFGDVATALTLRARFSEVLKKRRDEIEKTNAQALKEESLRYKNTTDGEWLKNREEFYKARTESEYLNEREQLLEVLIEWMGDVVRQKSVDRLDLPSEKIVTENVAQAHEVSDLLQRMEALEKLRSDLGTNVSEQLALEVAFLSAFA